MSEAGTADDPKGALREEVWSLLEEKGAARFPGAEGRIPNFSGAEDAAERLRGLDAWEHAFTLKANPDSPQWPVRQRALEDGKRVYMAVPRLRDPDPFFLLDPDDLEESPWKASSIKGASRNARTVAVEVLDTVDLVVTGCVAVSPDGARLGKGGGYSDLEWALAVEAGLLGPDTPIVTTAHPLQVVEEGRIPMTEHDIPLDWIVTPEEVLDCRGGPHSRPRGVLWEELPEAKIEAIPLLQRLSG